LRSESRLPFGRMDANPSSAQADFVAHRPKSRDLQSPGFSLSYSSALARIDRQNI